MMNSLSGLQKIILGLAVVVAILVGVLILSGRPVSERPGVLLPSPTVNLPPQPAPALRPILKTPTITQTTSVLIKQKSFQPAEIRVKPGTLVTWTNFDLSPHTVTGSGFNSGVLSQGSVWSQQFTKPGRYEYHCSVHPNMRGVVEVRE